MNNIMIFVCMQDFMHSDRRWNGLDWTGDGEFVHLD